MFITLSQNMSPILHSITGRPKDKVDHRGFTHATNYILISKSPDEHNILKLYKSNINSNTDKLTVKQSKRVSTYICPI